jgi:hypothetical protein
MYRYINRSSAGSASELKKQIEFATRNDSDYFYGIRYYSAKSDLLDEMYQLLPGRVHQDFYSAVMIINDDIPPHTDMVDSAALNCYMEPGDYFTNFYEHKPDAKKTEFQGRGPDMDRVENTDHNPGHVYNKAQLIQTGSFQAKPFDIYLIDNRCIHEVANNSVDKPTRRVLQLATDKYSFEQVCEMIAEQQ